MSHDVVGTAGQKTPEFTQTLSVTDKNDQMSHSYTTVTATVEPNVLIFNEKALELSHALDQQRLLSVWRHTTVDSVFVWNLLCKENLDRVAFQYYI